jgi:hypothetical protein
MEAVIDLRVPCVPVTRGTDAHFFGYYDKCPWSADGRYLLAMESSFDHRSVKVGDALGIGLIDLEDKLQFTIVASTSAWNWQEGAMAQWLPLGTHTILYNDRHDGAFCAVVKSLATHETYTLPRAIYAVSPDGLTGLSVDFARIHHSRVGYGYVVETPPQSLNMDTDGIYTVDVVTGKTNLILSYRHILEIDPASTLKEGNHWIQHLAFNQSGDRFVFLHRFSLPTGEYYTRVITANADGTDPHCLVSGMASHFCWKDASHLLVWARQRNFRTQQGLRAILRRYPFRYVLRWLQQQQKGWVRNSVIGDRFMLLADRQTERNMFAENALHWDGHPSFSPDGRWLTIDTYPDENQYQTLFLLDTSNDSLITLGRFHTPVRDGIFRCDLHPRWSRDGRKLCIDSAHLGTRQMFVLDVGEIIDEGEQSSPLSREW